MSSSPDYSAAYASSMATRFRGFLPVVVDVETGGFDCNRHALLEIAAIPLVMQDDGRLTLGTPSHTHVDPFEGSELDPKSLEVTGIDPFNPLRGALSERAALDLIFNEVRRAVRAAGCQRAILVGHNAAFDMSFIQAASARVDHKRNPFHPFSTFDTVSIGALAFGQTVLGRSLIAAGHQWDGKQAHSALYDAQMTAELFCQVINHWRELHLPTAATEK